MTDPRTDPSLVVSWWLDAEDDRAEWPVEFVGTYGVFYFWEADATEKGSLGPNTVVNSNQNQGPAPRPGKLIPVKSGSLVTSLGPNTVVNSNQITTTGK